MSGWPHRRKPRLVPALVLGGLSLYVLHWAGPVTNGPVINPVPAGAGFVLILCAGALISDTFAFLANVFERQAALTPTGLKGTAAWVTSLSEIKHDLIAKGWGPYWGAFKDREVMADFESNALTVGPAGSGKDVGEVQPQVLCIRRDKVVVDFKGSSTCVLADTLRARGETVRILNLGDMWSEIVGESDAYNPLGIIADNFWREGGLLDVSDDIHELGLQLYPEPEGGSAKDDNKYFRDGSRDLIGFAVQTCILIDGYMATLGDVAALLNDRESLLKHALWACGKLPQVRAISGETSPDTEIDPNSETGAEDAV